MAKSDDGRTFHFPGTYHRVVSCQDGTLGQFCAKSDLRMMSDDDRSAVRGMMLQCNVVRGTASACLSQKNLFYKKRIKSS